MKKTEHLLRCSDNPDLAENERVSSRYAALHCCRYRITLGSSDLAVRSATAATPYCSLYPPLAVVANVPSRRSLSFIQRSDFKMLRQP